MPFEYRTDTGSRDYLRDGGGPRRNTPESRGYGAQQQAYSPWDFGAYNFGQPIWDALGTIKGGKWRLDKVLGNIYGAGNQGMFQGVTDIDRAFLENLMGVANPMQQRFLNKLFRRMNGGGEEPAPGGGVGGGGMSSGTTLPNINVQRADPFSGQLGQYLEQIIQDLLSDPGIPGDVLSDMRTRARETSATRERNEIQRRASDYAARGLFGSGLQGGAVRDIEDANTQALMSSLNDIDLANVQAIQRSVDQAISAVGAAISREGGLNSFNLGKARLELDRAISEIQLSIQDLVARGQLELGQGRLLLDAAIQELMINLSLLGGML